ncbi:hypothetical protein MBGDN05_00322 [Thermoplasmatales archaeon SCGC AB-539-N05]|nr:hypothetical protein MBGDN05_00322 [Thermoplasmatales archaeon SCGC AB-539-N05]
MMIKIVGQISKQDVKEIEFISRVLLIENRIKNLIN